MKYKLPCQEQFSRVKRLRKDIERFSVATDENFETALDSFTSFFIQCYHMRDWLIKSGFRQIAIDNFIERSAWLSLCRDLANKQKHQKIDRYKPQNDFVDHGFGISTPISRYFDHFMHKEPRFGIDVWKFGIPVDVMEVAAKCVSGWDDFLQSQQGEVI
ncbi:MAG: hypothetical protein Q8P39_03325 [Candidatus Yanofskybacteria bacterium]|nr:hypothetical protein [Candidatus Yanofskybacteria bacterium]